MTSLIRAGAALAVLAFLGACQTTGAPLVEVTPGESRVEAELARQKANRDFRIDSVAPERIRLIARARPVVIEPADGLCLSPEATELTERGVFAVVADCLPPGGAAAFPGLITVSVAAEPMYPSGPGRKRELRRMRDFLGTAPGLAMLARGSAGAGVGSCARSRPPDRTHRAWSRASHRPPRSSPRHRGSGRRRKTPEPRPGRAPSL